MPFTVRVTLPQLPGRLKKLNKKLEKAILLGARKGARKVPTILKRKIDATTPYPPIAFGKYKRSWRVEIVPRGVQIANEMNYAQFVEVGRGPGKGPPMQALIKWALLKRFNIGGRSKRGSGKRNRKNKAKIYIATRIAWALFWKIKKRGVKGRYVIKQSIPEITRTVGRAIEIQMSRVIP